MGYPYTCFSWIACGYAYCISPSGSDRSGLITDHHRQRMYHSGRTVVRSGSRRRKRSYIGCIGLYFKWLCDQSADHCGCYPLGRDSGSDASADDRQQSKEDRYALAFRSGHIYSGYPCFYNGRACASSGI